MALAERMGWMRCPSGSSDATALLVPAVLHASPVARKGQASSTLRQPTTSRGQMIAQPSEETYIVTVVSMVTLGLSNVQLMYFLVRVSRA